MPIAAHSRDPLMIRDGVVRPRLQGKRVWVPFASLGGPT